MEAGTARLIGTDREAIRHHALELLTDSAAYEAKAQAVNPFGDGHASERILATVKTYLGGGVVAEG